MRWKDLLLWAPTLVAFACWRLSLYVQGLLDCHMGKSSALPCMWGATDLQGWLGGGMFFGMVICLISVPIAVVVQGAICLGRLEKRLKPKRTD